MGLFDKVKNLFTEEVEVEEENYVKPIKREKPIEVEQIRSEPVVSEVKLNLEDSPKIAESPVITREERPRMPVYFDDKAFEDLKGFEADRKDDVRKNNRETKFNKKIKNDNLYKGNNKDEIVTKKIFKPSPIISPVYGVLDKNYKKDDVKSKPNRRETVKITPTIDDVRAKAYGSLEDDLENTLFTSGTLTLDEKEIQRNLDESKDFLKDDKDLETTDLSRELELQRQKIDEINEYIKNNSVSKKKEKVDLKPELDLDSSLEENEGVESELFDLIDSMYEKRDEE